MKIVIFGASGFIGARIAGALRAAGHELRTPRSAEVNYLNLDEAAVRAMVTGQDVVVNAVGLMHYKTDILEAVHHIAVRKIAEIAKAAGVKRFLQLSALGADEAQTIAFVGSKGLGDAALRALADADFQVVIARPSMVYGKGGASSEAFARAAKLPLLLLPEGGMQRIQPVHVADLADGFVRMLAKPLANGSVVNMVGGKAVTLADYLSILRQTLWHKPPLRVLRVPDVWVRLATFLLEKPSTGLISAGNMQLLKQGNCAEVSAFADLLGRQPLKPQEFYREE